VLNVIVIKPVLSMLVIVALGDVFYFETRSDAIENGDE